MKTGLHLAVLGLAVLISVTRAQAAAVPDRLTPSDAEIVVQINVGQLLLTPLIKKHALDPLKALLEHNTETSELLRAAGLNPLQDIDTFSLCASGCPSAGGKLLVVVRGNFAPDKVRTAAEDYAKKYPDRVKNITDGNLPMWEIHSDKKSFYAAFAGSKTLVMTATKSETAAIVRRAGEAPQHLSPALRAALAHLKGNENVWLAMAATDELKQLLKSDNTSKDFAASLESVTGALELSENAQFGLVVHTTNAKAAAQVKDKLDELMPLLTFLGAGKDNSSQIAKQVIDSIKLKTEKNDVSIQIHVTDEQVDKVRKKER